MCAYVTPGSVRVDLSLSSSSSLLQGAEEQERKCERGQANPKRRRMNVGNEPELRFSIGLWWRRSTFRAEGSHRCCPSASGSDGVAVSHAAVWKQDAQFVSYNHLQLTVSDELSVPVAGLVWATDVPAETQTVAQAAASFGHIQSRILRETPPMGKKSESQGPDFYSLFFLNV